MQGNSPFHAFPNCIVQSLGARLCILLSYSANLRYYSTDSSISSRFTTSSESIFESMYLTVCTFWSKFVYMLLHPQYTSHLCIFAQGYIHIPHLWLTSKHMLTQFQRPCKVSISHQDWDGYGVKVDDYGLPEVRNAYQSRSLQSSQIYIYIYMYWLHYIYIIFICIYGICTYIFGNNWLISRWSGGKLDSDS